MHNLPTTGTSRGRTKQVLTILATRRNASIITALVVFILLMLLTTTHGNINGKSDDNDNDESDSKLLDCHLYMAKSTIPNAGLGIFAGKEYRKGSSTYVGLGDICISIIDMYTHINLYGGGHRSSDGTSATTSNTTNQNYYTNEKFSNITSNIIQQHRTNDGWVFNGLRDYFWSGWSMGMHHGESTTHDVEAYCPGLDCAINCHLGVVNIDKSTPIYNDYHSILSNDGVDENQQYAHRPFQNKRYVHPGTGAYSPYHIRPPPSTSSVSSSDSLKSKTNVLRTIPIGGELFKHYGDNWFVSRPHMFDMNHFPLTMNYIQGEKIIQAFQKLDIVQKSLQSVHYDDTMFDYYTVVHDLYSNIIIQTIQRLYSTPTLNTLPQNYSAIHQLLITQDVNSDVSDEEYDDHDDIIARVLQSKHQRSIQELQTNGVCLDHIRPETSTIPHAGYGAFATRYLPNNTIITASPLHHIPYSHNFMNMYKIQQHPHTMGHNDAFEYYRILDEVQNQQLLMNYCYGHINSTLLLCPYGSGINYINHHSTKYNVKLEWVSPNLINIFRHNHTAVEEGTVHELFLAGDQSRLAMQYRAIRDIQEGEELFIDYGIEWERSWKKHEEDFYNNYNQSEVYMSASYWNAVYGHLPIPTIYEIEKHAPSEDDNEAIYFPPNNLYVTCHRALLLQSDGGNNNVKYKYVWNDENNGVPCRIIDRYYSSIVENEILKSILEMDTSNSRNSNNSNESLPLMSADDIRYTVQIEWDDNNMDHVEVASGDNEDASSNGETSIVWMTRTDVPRSAMKFFDIPYTTDIHQRRTFRHPIYLSDELFPKRWRNLE